MRLVEAFESSTSVVAVMRGSDGVFLGVNAAFERSTGYRRDQVIGRLPIEIGLWPDPAFRARIWSVLRAEQRAVALPMSLACADGRLRPGHLSVEFARDGGETVVFCLVHLDPDQSAVPAAEAVVPDGFYRSLYLAASEGIYRSLPGGGFLDVNPAMARILGFGSPAALLAERGRNAVSMYVDPAHGARVHARLLAGERLERERAQVRRRDGAVIWVSENSRAIFGEAGQVLFFEGSLVDITAQVEAEQALLRSESKYRTLVEHSQVGVFIMAGERYTYANHAFAQMLGYREDELVGRDYREIMAPDAVPQSERRDQDRLAGRPVPRDFESVLVHREGRRVHVKVSIGPVLLDGVEHLTGTVLDITRQREAEERLRFHATHDPLTGLPNRMLFNQRLAGAMLEASRAGDPSYAVLFLDLDGFKWVNDSLGHGAGDRLLVQIARRLEDSLLSDVLIARYGGDEFTLLPDGYCDRDRAMAIARVVIGLFEQPFDVGGQQVFSSASVGIVVGRRDYESPDQVLRDADTAMYRAKARGKSAFVVFDEGMHKEALSRLQLETDFRLAFERAEFRLHYQPIVELATGRLVGAEALVRWWHPRRGLLAPADFLPLAEETGLIVDLDAWVLREACRQLGQWRERAPDFAALSMNVNVDERQMVSPGIVEEVFTLLQSHRIPADRLRLEVTETAFRAGRGQAEQRLLSLKALGVGLVVDDFGTGYSSLESFAASPFDALKMDQVFIRDIETNPRHRAIVRTITSFADELGLALTAEGIETPAQRERLRAIGCQYGQGYLFSPALPAEEFEQLLSGTARIVG